MKIKSSKTILRSLVNKCRQTDWSYERLDICPYFIACPTEAMLNETETRKYFSGRNIIITYNVGKFGVYHYTESEHEEIYQRVLSKIKKNFRIIFCLRKIWESKINYFYKECEKYKRSNLKVLGNRQLVSYHDKFYVLFKNSVVIPFFIEGITVGKRKIIDEELLEWLKKNGLEKHFSAIYQKLSTSEKSSFIVKMFIEMLEVLKGLNKKERSVFQSKSITFIKKYIVSHTNLAVRINKYLEKYSWSRNSYYQVNRLTLDNFIEEVKYYFKKGDSTMKQIKQFFDLIRIKQEKARTIKKFKLPTFLQEKLRLLSLLAYWQDQRKKSIFKGLEIMDSFLTELARRTRINKAYLKFSFPQEYRSVLGGKLNINILKKRKSNLFIIWRPSEVIVVVGHKAKLVNNFIFKQEPPRNIKEVKGISVSPGTVRGYVKKLLSAQQGNKMNQGDILVTGMTRPDFINSMRKAAAIITDEGGITCHAAIISRELKIPCVVGTKVATKVLKDGDLVEVDANKGIIKKLT